MAMITKYAIRLENGRFLHRNPVKTIRDPFITTTDLSKIKMWEKEGMMLTWADKQYHKAMLDKESPMWQVVEIECTYLLK